MWRPRLSLALLGLCLQPLASLAETSCFSGLQDQKAYISGECDIFKCKSDPSGAVSASDDDGDCTIKVQVTSWIELRIVLTAFLVVADTPANPTTLQITILDDLRWQGYYNVTASSNALLPFPFGTALPLIEDPWTVIFLGDCALAHLLQPVTIGLGTQVQVPTEVCAIKGHHSALSLFAVTSGTFLAEKINFVAWSNPVNGGAVLVSGGSATFQTCYFWKNFAARYGGACHITGGGSKGRFFFSHFIENSAGYGGALGVDERATCEFGNGTLHNNAANGITYNFVTNGPDFLLDNGAVLFLSPVDDQNDIDALIGFEARIENLDDFR